MKISMFLVQVKFLFFISNLCITYSLNNMTSFKLTNNEYQNTFAVTSSQSRFQDQKIQQESYFQDEHQTLNPFQSFNKRVLATNTCPDYTIYFPVFFGLSATSCNEHVLQTGFNVDVNNNLISSGYVSSTAAANCSEIYGPILNDNYAYAFLNATNSLRIIRIAASTGVQDLEKNFDFASASTTTFRINQLVQVSTETDIYGYMTIQTSFFAASSDFEGILMKLNKDLVIQWFQRSRGHSSDYTFSIDDICVTSNSIWTLNFYYKAQFQYTNSVQKIQKSDGKVLQELRWANSAPTVNIGTIVLNNDETKWYTVNYGSSNLLTHQAGNTASNTMVANFMTGLILKEVNCHIVIYKLGYDLIFPSENCASASTTSVIGSTAISMMVQSSTNPLFPVVSEASDTSTASCMLPYESFPKEIIYDLNTDGGTAKEIGPISVTSCSGTEYSITGLQNADGTAITGTQITYVSATKSIKIMLLAADYANYVGSFYYRIGASYSDVVVYTQLQITVQPLTSYVRDPQVPNHDTSSCFDKTYPFFYGHTLDVNLQDFKIDNFGNFLIAGSGIKPPFGSGGTIENGFLSMMDQRGSPYWTYKLNTLQDTTSAQYCYQIVQSSDYVYGLCQSKASINTGLGAVGILIKLYHNNGKLISTRLLPDDRYQPQNQLPLFIQVINTNRLLVIQRYQSSAGAQKSFSAFLFDESTQSKIWYYYYPTDTVFQDMNFLVDQTNGYFYQFKHALPNKEQVFQLRLSDGVMLLKSLLTTTTSDVKTFPAFYGTDKLLSPFVVKSTSDQIHVLILKRLDLTRVTNFFFTFPSTANIESASVESDSSLNIYISASYSQMFFAKISSSYTVTEQRMWKQEYTNYFSTNGIQMYQDIPFYAFKGLYASTDKNSFMIFKDSKTYNYVDIPILSSTETQFYPSFSNTILNPVITAQTGIQIAGPTEAQFTDFLQDVGGIKWTTLSFSNLASDRLNWDIAPFPNKFRAYPLQGYKQSMIDIQGAGFTDPTIYEFTQTSGTQTIVLTLPPSGNSCQGRPKTLQVLNPYTALQTLDQTFVTFDSIDTISINTNAVVRPLQFSLKVRYADLAVQSSEAFLDYAILIRIVAQQNLTIAAHDQKECFQNQFSMSFGSNCNTCFVYTNGFYLNKDDENIILVGQADPTNAFFLNVDADQDDALIARISPTGWVYWLNQVSSKQGVDDAITAITMSNGFIFCFFNNYGSTEPNRIHAILKITYEEGKIQWTKRIIPYNPIDTKSFVVASMRYMTVNPYNSSQIVSSLSFYWNSDSMYSGNIMFFNDETNFKSDYNIVIKPLAKLTASRNTPGQIQFHPDSNFAYLAHASYTISSSSQDLMIIKYDVSTKQILWSNTYNDGRSLPNWDLLQPNLAFCTRTSFLYMVATNNHVHIVKLDQNGQTLKRQYLQMTAANLNNIEIVANEANGQVILIGITLQYYVFLQLDSDLVPIGYTFRSEPHNGAQITRGNLQQKGSDYYLMGINIGAFGTTTPTSEVAFWKHHYTYQKKWFYDCHSFPVETTYIVQNYAAANTVIPSLAIVISPQQLYLFDADFVKSYQLQQYGTGLLYPNGDKSHTGYFQESQSLCENTGISPPAMQAFPAFEVLMGEQKTFDISSFSFKQCQKMGVTYTVYDEAQSLTRTANNNFITISQNSQLIVDARTSPPYPSQRILQIVACNQVFTTKCSMNEATLVIWPSDIVDAPKTEGTAPTCQGQLEFPKILGYPGQYFSLTQADMDKDNGNFVMCGRTSIVKFKNIQYPNTADGGLIVFSSVFGQIYWSYSVQRRINAQIAFFSSCVITSDDFIYTLIYRATSTDMSLVKLSYERGKIIYSKLIPGTFDILQNLPKVWIDNENNNGYITGYRQDIVTYSLYIQKIDLTIEPQMIKWYSYAIPTGTTLYSSVQSVGFPTDSSYFFVYGYTNVMPQNDYYNYIQKYDSVEGKILATVNHPRYLTTSNQKIFVNADFIYFASAEYKTSIFYKYMRQYNHNLQVVNGYYFILPTTNQVLWTSLSQSSDSIFELFHYAAGYYYIAKYDKTNILLTKLLYFQTKLQPAYDEYWEQVKQPDIINFYEAKVFKFKGDQPRYLQPLVNQIIQLPISSPQTYTFDYPNDCQFNLLIFTWSVDFYSSPPSFLTFTTDSIQATLSINPTNLNIGTYTIRVIFTNSKDTLQYTEDYFQVEIYPEIPYPDKFKCFDCPSRPMTMTFGVQSDYVINYMDIDSKADYYILCGSTKTLQTIADTYSQSFILQYTRGYAMTFHITMEAGTTNNFAQQCNYGFQNQIYTMIQSFSQTLGAVDSVYITTHTNYGKFQDGRVFKMQDLNLRADQMIVDSNSGDTYLMGKQTGILIAFNSIKHVFLMKYDQFYQIKFFRFYEYGPSEGREITIDYLNLAIYMIHTYLYSPFSKSYYAVVKADLADGNLVWAKTLRDNSGQIYQQISTPNQQLGIQTIDNFIYSCLHYQTSGLTTTGTELYLSKHDQDTGLISSQLQFGFNSGTDVFGCTLQYSQASSQLLMQYGGTGLTYIAFINIAVDPMTVKSSLLKTSFASSTNYKQYLIERNAAMFSFISYVQSSISYMTVLRINDFTSPAWEDPCISGFIQSVDTSVYSGYNLPNGINGDQSIHWKDLTPYTSRLVDSAVINFYFTKMMNFRSYHVTDTTADVRTNSGSCSKYSNPSFPQILGNRVGPYINMTAGSIPVGKLTYQVSFNTFDQCSYDQMTYSLKLSTGAALPSFMVHNPVTNIVTIQPSLNLYKGLYTLRYQATLTASPLSINYTDVQVEISENQAPFALEDFNKSVVMFAHHTYDWAIYFDYDRELDDSQFEVFFMNANNVTITVPWFQILVQNSDQISFSATNPPQPASGSQTQYYIQVNIWDELNIGTKRKYFISLIIKQNQAPYLTQIVPTIIPKIYITQKFDFIFPYNYVIDREEDTIFFTCTTSTNNGLSASWITITIDPLGNFSIAGQSPRDNSFAGIYTFTCQLNDQYDGSPNIYTFSLQVQPKPQVQVNKVQNNISFLIPENITINFDEYFSDQLGEPFTIKLLINGTMYGSISTPWLNWDISNLQLDIKGSKNQHGGNHSIQFQCDDSITVPTVLLFKVEIIQNWPLNIISPIKDLSTQANSAFIKFINVSNVFIDPEGKNFTYFIQEKDSLNKQVPYFIFRFYPNGSFGGYTTDVNVGSYNLEYIGIDSANQQTVASFQFFVRRMIFRNYQQFQLVIINAKLVGILTIMLAKSVNQVSTFISMNAWMSVFLEPSLMIQIKCAKNARKNVCYVSELIANLNVQDVNLDTICLIMAAGSHVRQELTETSPKAHVKVLFVLNPLTIIECHSSCSKCYGPSHSNCYSCNQVDYYNEKNELKILGYNLVGNDCRIPQCLVRQYFEWFPVFLNDQISGLCKDCHPTCRRCVGPNENDCLQCILGYEFDPKLFICIKCEDIIGMETNLNGECEDMCGDGIIINKQCDDGNRISGDGCNNECEVEFGYECLVANQPCRENIRPDYRIVTVSKSNQIFFEFTEDVYINNQTSISPSNLRVSITRNQIEYKFSWRIAVDKNNKIIPNQPIKRFSIILFDIKQSMTGREQLNVQFIDETQIFDQAGNYLLNGQLKTINPKMFVYFTSGEDKLAKVSGQVVKVSFVSVCSFNIAFKVLMNSSMQYLWGLVHALQVFNFLLYINIEFPENVQIFASYLSVASGEFEELNSFIPVISDYIIEQGDVNEPYDLYILDQKFLEDEISPYFIIAFGQKLTLWCVGLLFILPVAMILNKIWKKVQFWEEVVQGFFFNGPLRTFVEMYIELILQVLINTKFIKFSNFSQMVSTCTASAFGFISLFLPFLTMTIIYHNRKKTSHNFWNSSFGMLTEEVKSQYILQLYYYPIMMYQRLLIAAIIVYLSSYPLIQCVFVILLNIIMTAYLIIYKPFKLESQQVTSVVDEIMIGICVCTFIYIHEGQIEIEQLKRAGWFVIFLILISMGKNLAIVIYYGILVAKNKYFIMFRMEDEAVDSPSSSIASDESSNQQIDTQVVYEEVLQGNLMKCKLSPTSRSLTSQHDFRKNNPKYHDIFQKQYNSLANGVKSPRFGQSMDFEF
ncbi:cadg multi-domain protein [Stylonychia lemnae]|uniref:Cadg multi-domain protein n=1 Tax=Stylonychia lemnae TaxID=5949 RepID=A0A078AZ24_STYLE|nr:cadg multi-domain protein [Stylonychia lemnae]|eukprot:CDW86063.1 cadg multi-domain protein [Stylonychia lemnae]